MFYAMYPITEVEIKVRSPFVWNNTLSSNGNGWENMLNAIADLRNQDNAPFEEYYYGIFEPQSSLNQYCSGGCVLGLGFLGGPQDAFAHAAIGIGYGRRPLGGDSGARAGSQPWPRARAMWQPGASRLRLPLQRRFDRRVRLQSGHQGALQSGQHGRHDELLRSSVDQRLHLSCPGSTATAFNNGVASVHVPAELRNKTWQRVLVRGDGTHEWMAPITLPRPVVGEAVTVTAQTTAGSEQLSGSFLPYDHIDGGILFMPQTQAPLIAGGALQAVVEGQLVNVIQ